MAASLEIHASIGLHPRSHVLHPPPTPKESLPLFFAELVVVHLALGLNTRAFLRKRRTFHFASCRRVVTFHPPLSFSRTLHLFSFFSRRKTDRDDPPAARLAAVEKEVKESSTMKAADEYAVRSARRRRSGGGLWGRRAGDFAMRTLRLVEHDDARFH